MRPPSSQEQEINLLELVKKVWDSRKLILRMCDIQQVPLLPRKAEGLIRVKVH